MLIKYLFAPNLHICDIKNTQTFKNVQNVVLTCHFKQCCVLMCNLEPFVQLEVPILLYSCSFLLVSVATQSKRSARAVTDLIRGAAFSHKLRALINEQKHEAREHHTN